MRYKTLIGLQEANVYEPDVSQEADVDRIYLPYQEGGRGPMNLEKEYKTTMVGVYQLHY